MDQIVPPQDDWLGNVLHVAWLAALSFIGIMARHTAAAAAVGHICIKCFLLDAAAAPFLGILAGALCQWWNVPLYATWAAVSFVGFLGPAFVAATAEKVRDAIITKKMGS